ncbi:prepilin peptidase [Candidatus Nomurabacteria bacterium]|nr:prepilin peptidase [Candidatus Nomurabacteria bacterium]
MVSILTIIFFIFGAIIGSFLNVVILRYNTQKSFGGRSSCMSCRNKLNWYELIPMFSYLFLKGKCKNCKTNISIQYFLVEFITGFLFALLFFKLQNIFYGNIFNFIFSYGYYAVFFCLLMIIAVYDMRHKIIPDMLVVFLSILSFCGLFLFSDYSLNLHLPNISEFVSGFVISIPFALMWLFSKGTWMGLGDAKLMIPLGWFLGISRLLSGVVISFWTGAFIGVLLLFFSDKHKIKSEIPFAPFLIIGSFISFLFELNIFSIAH